MPPPNPPCQAVKRTNGDLCGNTSSRTAADTHPAHLHFCGVHKHTYRTDVGLTEGVHHAPGRCLETVMGPWDGQPLRRVPQWCPHVCAPGAPYCFLHEARRQNRVARAAAIVAARVAAALAGPPPPLPVGHGDLRQIARDAQNVHVRVVSEQTNRATETLLAVVVPDTQQTERDLAIVWLTGFRGLPYPAYLRVANDMHRWFNVKDCRAPDDSLYRKLLRGVVAWIGAEKDAERKSELYRRLWEECSEAVGLCCEGHLSRLCNTLVGFDDAFQPAVPFGEILQSKMAAIAAMDVSDDEKRRQATAFFDEHKTPSADRVAWLEAF
jgi:hypothetical protein